MPSDGDNDGGRSRYVEGPQAVASGATSVERRVEAVIDRDHDPAKASTADGDHGRRLPRIRSATTKPATCVGVQRPEKIASKAARTGARSYPFGLEAR